MPVAPVCPATRSQVKLVHGLVRGSIPPATDLPSLIRTVNLISDILRSLTTSLTVNNVYNPRQPTIKVGASSIYSQYPQWKQREVQTSLGYVYHKSTSADGTKKIDKTQRAYVQRINYVKFVNTAQNDPDFYWAYAKPLDLQLPE